MAEVNSNDAQKDAAAVNTVDQGTAKTDTSTPDHKTTGNGDIKVSIEPDEPKDFIPKLSDLMDKSMNLSRRNEQGIINEKTGSAVVVREDGQINLSSSKYSQYKLSMNGRATEMSMESVTMTNRKKLQTDELMINNHKLNPQLWELSDFKENKLLLNQHAIVGNLCMMGSVLVKAWEPNLKRYVMIRRPWRGPVFGTTVNVPEINSALGISDPLKLNEDIMALSDKGYQVNAIISDAASLVGKAGVDRSGIIRNTDALDGNSIDGSAPGGQNGKSGKLGGGVVERKKIWDALILNGYNEVCTAAIMGNMNQESKFDTHADNGSHVGLCQWDTGGRWANLCSMENDPYDAGSQVNFLIYEATGTRYPDECSPSAMNAKFSSADQVEAATIDWLKWFEGALGQEEAERSRFAREIYDEFHKK